ncbi:MAG: putative transporter [Puniceicoccales bacterium]|jgi:putative transport protein|nr:putative transporter [Puniceicoccales bacterium]
MRIFQLSPLLAELPNAALGAGATVPAHGMAAQTMLLLCVVIAAGMAAGSLKVKGMGLGAAAVLFSGLAFGHAAGAGVEVFRADAAILDFARDFGLALFVYAVGLQVGPSFLGSLRKQGLGLNALAAAVVLLGVGIAAALVVSGVVTLPQGAGIYTGAVTNTPAMAAAGQALPGGQGGVVAIGYAVAYPGAVAGIIGAMLLLRWLFRIDVGAEAREHAAALETGAPGVARVTARVDNPGMAGRSLADVSGILPDGVVISRVRRAGVVREASAGLALQSGDRLLLVGDSALVYPAAACFGCVVEEDLTLGGVAGGAGAGESVVPPVAAPCVSQVSARRVFVTAANAIGTRLGALRLPERLNVVATRVGRGGRELPASRNLVLQAGDLVTVVGTPTGLDGAARVLGDSLKALNHPHFIPLFLGLAAGIGLGVQELHIPGVPAPLKLGLAGGPLLVALVTGSLLRVGPLVFYLPPNALLFMRELGIALFLACVGLKSGPGFWPSILAGGGAWVLYGAVLTVVPLLVVGVLARKVWGMNYLTLCGVLSGAMTDPPALCFAQGVTRSEGAAVAYSLVYPLTMFLRILTAQLLVILLC